MRSLSPRVGARLLACGIALLFALPLFAWFDAPIHRPQDEGMLLVYPELLIRGLLPHRDFLATYPPGNFYLLALGYQLFEPSVVVERSFGLAYRITLILGLVALGWRRGASIGAACGITAALILHPLRLEAFSWIAGVALLTWGAVALCARRRVLAGVLLGLSLWFRLDLALAAGLVAGAHVVWDSSPISSDMRGRLARVGLGLLVPLVSLILYFVVISPQNAVDDLLFSPIFVTGPARRLPFSSLGTNSIRLLLLLTIGVATALLAAWRSRESVPGERADAFVLAALGIGLLPQVFQRLDADHLLYGCVVAGSLLPAALDRMLDRLLDRIPVLLVTTMIVLATVGTPGLRLVGSSLEHLAARPQVVYIQRDDRRLPARSEHEISAFFDLGTILDHQAQPGERLFIGPADLSRTNYSDLHLYYLFPELVPASYFIELNPGSANRLGTRLTQDLASADWLLLSREWDHWNEPNASSELGDSRPNRVVRKQFESIAQHGVWELHRRRQAR